MPEGTSAGPLAVEALWRRRKVWVIKASEVEWKCRFSVGVGALPGAASRGCTPWKWRRWRSPLWESLSCWGLRGLIWDVWGIRVPNPEKARPRNNNANRINNKKKNPHCCAKMTQIYSVSLPSRKDARDRQRGRCGWTYKVFFAHARHWRRLRSYTFFSSFILFLPTIQFFRECYIFSKKTERFLTSELLLCF